MNTSELTPPQGNMRLPVRVVMDFEVEVPTMTPEPVIRANILAQLTVAVALTPCLKRVDCTTGSGVGLVRG